MGCDIHCYAEKQKDNGAFECLPFMPFDWRSYGMYGFLADVRNYSAVPPIQKPNGFPGDASRKVRKEFNNWGRDAHSSSWNSVSTLAKFDYDATMEDLRYTKQIAPNHFDGGATAEPGQGKKTTFREFLGDAYFRDMEKLKELEADRIVFWFDN